MSFTIKEEDKFKYVEEGDAQGETLILLHGLMGGVENFPGVIEHFSKTHHVVLPILPIYDLPIHNVGLEGIFKHIVDFINFKG